MSDSSVGRSVSREFDELVDRQYREDRSVASPTPEQCEWDRVLRFLESWGYALRDSDGKEVPEHQLADLRGVYASRRG